MSKLITNTSELHLGEFTGTENWYRHALVKNMLYTDGVKYVIETCGAYWLLDIIATEYFPNLEKFGGFLTIEMKSLGSTGRITVTDGNENILKKRSIAFTNFPTGSVTFWMENNILYLPNER